MNLLLCLRPVTQNCFHCVHNFVWSTKFFKQLMVTRSFLAFSLLPVSGEPGIACCSCWSDIYFRECGHACMLIDWSLAHKFVSCVQFTWLVLTAKLISTAKLFSQSAVHKSLNGMESTSNLELNLCTCHILYAPLFFRMTLSFFMISWISVFKI